MLKSRYTDSVIVEYRKPNKSWLVTSSYEQVLELLMIGTLVFNARGRVFVDKQYLLETLMSRYAVVI